MPTVGYAIILRQKTLYRSPSSDVESNKIVINSFRRRLMQPTALPSLPLSMGVTSSKPRLVCARVYQRDVRGRNLTQSDLTSASKPLNWSTVKGKPHWGWRSVRQGVGSLFAYQSSLIFNDLNNGLTPFLGRDFQEHLFKRTTVQRNLPRPINYWLK